MKSQQLLYQNRNWSVINTNTEFNAPNARLVFAFGANELIADNNILQYLQKKYPNADIVSASTSGEIISDQVYDNTIVVNAIEFNETKIKCVQTNLSLHANSLETGKFLMEQIEADDLSAIFILSDGTQVNGSDLIIGLNEKNAKSVPISGGLAGDALRLKHTLVGLNLDTREGNVVAICFYGRHLKIGMGSFGGWSEFGRERIVSKSDKNILYELDGKCALDLYKEYLGPYAEELPGSAFYFPISVSPKDQNEKLVRTILSIDEVNRSMTFAGNIPEGSKVRLMKASFKNLIDGSETAAQKSMAHFKDQPPELAIVVSCAGRKVILQDRSYEELLSAKNILGNDTLIIGFYSYGEISLFEESHDFCELYNQTMTLTCISETA